MMRRALVVAGEIPSGAPTAQESKAQTPA